MAIVLTNHKTVIVIFSIFQKLMRKNSREGVWHWSFSYETPVEVNIVGTNISSFMMETNIKKYIVVRVAKSDLNSTDAYFATTKLAPKNGPKMT